MMDLTEKQPLILHSAKDRAARKVREVLKSVDALFLAFDRGREERERGAG